MRPASHAAVLSTELPRSDIFVFHLAIYVKLGVEFWATMYIPIVVAMAAQQNVVAAVRGGPIVLIAAVGAVSLCFAAVALIGHLGRDPKHEAEVEPELERGGKMIAGSFQPGDPEHAFSTAKGA